MSNEHFFVFGRLTIAQKFELTQPNSSPFFQVKKNCLYIDINVDLPLSSACGGASVQKDTAW